MMTPIRAAAIRTLYGQMRNQAFAGAVITLYMIGTAWAFTSHRVILLWTAAVLGTQLFRLILRHQFYRRPQGDDELLWWARVYTANTTLIGLAWAASFVLFAHLDAPITVALTISCLYSIASGSTPSHAYYPPSLYVMIAPIYVTVLVRSLATGQWGYILFGIASALYGLTMIGFCRTQARTIEDGFRIRFENEALVASLTEQKAQVEQAWRKAEVASLAKSQFLAAASHDLRQPLYALSLFSTSLGTLRLDAEGHQVVASIQNSVAVMESLFVGLLDISKLEAGVVRPHIAPVSVDALFDRLSQYFHPVAVERELDLRFRSDGEWVASDEALLEQVLSNLVSNALRCTVTGGVLVAARRRQGAIGLEIWDTGPGIGAADRERIFDEFVQLGNPERDRRKGLGLGLSIARRSAALIGSVVDLASRPGRGSRFRIAQPPVDAPRMPVALARNGPALLPLARDHALPILIVEDDLDVRLALTDLLRRWNLATDAVAEADAALDLIAAGKRYGLIVSDYRLRGEINGLDLIATIRRTYPLPAPPCVLITGDFHAELIALAHDAEVPLLLKPLKPDDLRQLLGALG